MEPIVNISEWYASPAGISIKVFGREKHLHVLPRYATDKLIMQEVSYHLSIGLLVGQHRKKKVPWPTLPLQIGLYEIKSLKDVDVKAKDIVMFEFSTKDFNPYDPHSICKDHYVRVYFPWIHKIFHWPEEDLWRYCYNATRYNFPVNLVRTWKASL